MVLVCLWRTQGKVYTVTRELAALYLTTARYLRVNRGSGGLGSWAKAKAQDVFNKYYYGTEFGRDEWFALFKDDWSIGDGTWIDGVH